MELVLREGALSILIGVPPPLRELTDRMKRAHGGTVFKQCVVLSSHKLVQLCNFVKRCRKEKQVDKYLVLLNYVPHRESDHLLHVFRDLNLTLVLFGGVCVMGGIQEVVESYRVSYILEWYLEKRICGVEMAGDKMVGYVGGSELDGATLRAWVSHRRPDTFTHASFKRAASVHYASATPGSVPFAHEHCRPHNAPSTETMSVRKACVLLEISEAESYSQESVRKAYLKKALRVHPDKNPAAGSEFAALAEAKSFMDAVFARKPI